MNVFELMGTIAIKNRDANAAILDTTQRAERASSKISAAFKKIGEMSIKIAKPIMTGAAAIGTAWAATIEHTRDYRTAMSQLDTAFLTNGHSAETARKTYKALQAVLGDTDQAVEASTSLAKMVKNEEDLSKWTEICMGIFAEYQGKLPIEGLTEAANETAKVGQVTGNLADALNWAGVSEDDFNKKLAACTSEEKRQELIMNTLYWTYKAAADQYKETGASVMEANAAQEKLNSVIARLGEIGEPILTKIKQLMADWITIGLQWLIDHGKAVSLAIATMGTAMALGAASAHPYAAGIMAVVAALTALAAKEQDVISGKIFNKYSQKDLETLQEYVDAMKAVKEAENAMINDGYGTDSSLKWIETTEAAERAAEKVNKTKGLMNDYYAFLQKNGVGKGNDIYLDVPIKVADNAESDVQAEINNMSLIGTVKLNPDMSGIYSALGSLQSFTAQVGGYVLDNSIISTPDGSHASGLPYVPRDGYIARLHKGEEVLSRRDAESRRSGEFAEIKALLTEMAGYMRAGQVIKLDSGVMAGQLAPAIDARLGSITRHKGRGN